MTKEEKPTFEKELEELINRHSKENGSDTPDFILAEYLLGCLNNFNTTIKERESWYGRQLKNNQTPSSLPDDGGEKTVCTDNPHEINPGEDKCSICGTPYVHNPTK